MSFSPYQNNGGTTLAIAGDSFVVVAADTRLSLGYSIFSRNCSKIVQLTDKCVIATAGMQSDAATLHKTLRMKTVMYEHEHNKQMSTTALGQLLSNTLYMRRFFPYYTFNIVAGLDEEGKGAVYTYDAIGSGERVSHSSQGTGQTLIQPFLDNQVKRGNQLIEGPPLTKDEAVKIAKDAFTSASERDIYTGDAMELLVIDEEGVQREVVQLRKD